MNTQELIFDCCSQRQTIEKAIDVVKYTINVVDILADPD